MLVVRPDAFVLRAEARKLLASFLTILFLVVKEQSTGVQPNRPPTADAQCAQWS